VATVTVPRFGDRAQALALPARALTHDEPDVARELAGSLEPAPIPDLRGEDHRRVEGDPAEALQRLDGGLEGGQLSQAHDLAIELLAALQLVQEERMIFAKHEPIGRREWRLLAREVLEPVQMRRGPVGALACPRDR
jgi:hypothetical protein